MLSIFFLVVSGCSYNPKDKKYFVEVGAEVGIDFVHKSGSTGDYFLFETMGSGVAFFDFDRDGWQDIYLVNGFDLGRWKNVYNPVNNAADDNQGFWVTEDYIPPMRFDGRVDSSVYDLIQELPVKHVNSLYKNNKAEFFNVTETVGGGDQGYGMGVTSGDYNNDGFVDLYITNFGKNSLFLNASGVSLSEVAESKGVDDSHWSSSAAFFDAENDGDLDLYVVNYLDVGLKNNRICGQAVSAKSKSNYRLLFIPRDKRTYCSPRRYNGAPDILYINSGDGYFENRTREHGVFSAYGKGLGVSIADFDRDGDSDIFVANDGMRNFYYRNSFEGKFVEEALEVGLAYNKEGQPEAGMGIAAADYDYDFDIDLLVTNFSRETNTLYENMGDAIFMDRSRDLGLHEDTWLPLGFGTFFFDADNDTDLDLFFANGHVLDRITMQDSTLTYEQANQVFLKEGVRFIDRTKDSGMLHSNLGVSRGAAAGDFDNDGDLDLLVNDIDGPAKLYRNLTKNKHWLMVELVGTKSNRDGIGTELRIVCDGEIQTRWHLGGGSYLSVGDPRIHFGLGNCSKVENLEVKWPSGINQNLLDIEADQVVRVVENN
tara:strand:+ start:238 stop:2031 length:1794 start_codon:yes stop_codon:yes gene_type:complete